MAYKFKTQGRGIGANGLSGGSVVKYLPADAGDTGFIPGP